MSDLKRFQENPLSRVEVGVISKANPEAQTLRLARVVVQRTDEIRDIFAEAKLNQHPADWIFERLEPELWKFFPQDKGAASEAARFLADEYVQIGDSLLLISSDTGKALARITDEDFYLPAPVPRESGGMAQPTPRLKPHIEGFIVQWTFDRAHEEAQVNQLLQQVPQTQLLRDEGDSRLLATTRVGRQLLSRQVKDGLPDVLPTATGIAKAFLDFFPLGDPGAGMEKFPLEAFSSYRSLLQDGLARNLKYDLRKAILGNAATSWVRNAASLLVDKGQLVGGEKTVEEAVEERQLGLWMVSPNVAAMMRDLGLRVRTLVVPTIPDDRAAYVESQAGVLKVDPESYWSSSREVHDKWTVATEMKADLYVDWSKVHLIALRDVLVSGSYVES